jgi:rhamnogalacturonyl hydrolase YesR
MLSRRDLLAMAAVVPKLPSAVPPGVYAILKRLLSQEPSALNTDWFGTMPLLGALHWRRRGVAAVEPFAKRWLSHHLSARDVAKYSGNRSRVVWAGGVPLTTYAGHFGMSQVCEEMVDQFGDERAKRIAVDLAEIVLHRTARNQLGLIGHDDTADFAIPDVTYFAVSSLMIAARFDPQNRRALQEQAVYQLRTAIDTFLMPDTGLARTLFRGAGVGQTYWTRASGWLLWSIAAMLRRLTPRHPATPNFLSALERLVEGMVRVQDSSGGFHVLLDDPSTPLDSTGPAMFVWAAHEAIRRKWLSDRWTPAVDRAWAFVRANLTDDGVLRQTYYTWAIPAENRQMRLKDETAGWAIGFVLVDAYEMTL